ncbi:MAG: hypothetical protein ACJ8BF_00040 [Gemmatimonadales bacterium]
MQRFLPAFALISFASCGGDGAGVAPLEAGTLEITTVTSGPEPDPDGYGIEVDGTVRTAIEANATLGLGQVTPGIHAIQLSGLAPNCTVAQANPRSVTLAPGETTPVRFSVTCHGTVGALQVTTSTTGSTLDPDGYILALNGKDRLRIGVNEVAVFSRILPGGYTVLLRDLAPNCEMSEESARSAEVIAGATATITLTIGCS